jgi:TorA maturation chaperone TorD
VSVVAEPGVGLAALWRLLSLGLAAPREETVGDVAAIAEALEAIGHASGVEDVLSAVRRTDVDAVAEQYQRLFGGSVAVSPYEGGYEPDPIRQGRQMADVAAFYRAFGAEAHGPAAERPDHVGCELEFLAFLELRRLAAADEGDAAGAALVDDIARAFLADHVGRWLPTFFARLYEAAEKSLYFRALAALGATVLEGELARRGIEPEPVPSHRAPLPVEADSLACGAARPVADPEPSYKSQLGSQPH